MEKVHPLEKMKMTPPTNSSMESGTSKDYETIAEMTQSCDTKAGLSTGVNNNDY
jgi:hypothetical protein|tara:strand:- start:301 stop:462 length:162 start_codon:yes stop_codon:yes gene_type:complete